MTTPTEPGFHQIAFSTEEGSAFGPSASTFGAVAPLRLWNQRVAPWLRTNPDNTPDPSFCYGVFDTDAVLIRRDQRDGAAEATAHLLIGSRDRLTPRLALELADWVPESGATELTRLDPATLDSVRRAPDPIADRQAAVRLTLQVLSHALGKPKPIVAPVSAFTYTVLWTVYDILSVLRSDLPAAQGLLFGFETYDDRPDPEDMPGLFLRFRTEVAMPDPDPALAPVALHLLTAYAQDGPDGLRAMLAANRILTERTVNDRVELMTQVWSDSTPRPHSPPTGAPMASPTPTTTTATATTAAQGRGPQVPCPVCLGRITWQDLQPLRYDIQLDKTVPIEMSPETGPEQRGWALRNAIIRCPNPGATVEDHYLPANYGSYGPPAVFGLIGATRSGKTHLMATMIAAIEQGGLGAYGLSAHPLELSRHQRVMRDMVRPLINDAHPIASTRDGLVEFFDGFLISGGGVSPDGVSSDGVSSDGVPDGGIPDGGVSGLSGGHRRPMALFDVAGRELTDVEDSKRFLDLAEGLIFVVDPDQFEHERIGDLTFLTVLDLLRDSGRLSEVSAAIVLNKADLLKFDDPIAVWLRHDEEVLNADETLRESADVYAYLHQRGARAWTRPYDECRRSTLHVASALGSDSLSRGVHPQRVLRPLVSLMAMTGLLDSEEAAKVGI